MSVVLQKSLIAETEQSQELRRLQAKIRSLGLEVSGINNRRYLGNKYALSDFIRSVVDRHCPGVEVVADVFSGTGAVADLFKDRVIITNDLLYSNYLSHVAWFSCEPYRADLVIDIIDLYNHVYTAEDNYVRANFADTFFSADNCSKIGFIREDIETLREDGSISFREYALLITSLLYAMDRIANTVGHYDAYRKGVRNDDRLTLRVLLPEEGLSPQNRQYNLDANQLVRHPSFSCDLLYLDPPYNSRQYCDAYHLLENIARWEKPEVHGVARKMDRSRLKSKYSMDTAPRAFRDLITHVGSKTKYILLSYNNTAKKGSPRSHAKISDEEILATLEERGRVTVFEQKYRAFTTGKSDAQEGNRERLFLCEVGKNRDGDDRERE